MADSSRSHDKPATAPMTVEFPAVYSQGGFVQSRRVVIHTLTHPDTGVVAIAAAANDPEEQASFLPAS